MIKYLILTALASSKILALTPEKIFEISSKEHNANNVQQELAIFGKHRKYRLEVEIEIPKNAEKSPALVMNVKFIDGKYAVSDFSFDMNGKKITIISVVEYNSKESTYDQWSLNMQTKQVFQTKGILLNGTKVVSWVNVDQRNKNGIIVSTVTDYDKQIWREVHMQDGVTVFGLSGKFTPVK